MSKKNEELLNISDTKKISNYDKEFIKNKKESKFKTTMLIISFISALTYYLVYIKTVFDSIEYVKNIINASLLIIIFLLIVIALISNKKVKNIFSILISIAMIFLVSINVLVMNNKLKLPTNEVLISFINESLTSAMKYTNKHNIIVSSVYEFSDNVLEGNIISQDILEGTLLKKIDKINLVVSNGPNYDKELILSNWVGRNLDELLKYIDENHLNNVTLDFKIDDENEKDIIINQSTKGEIKRNTSLSFTISLGNNELKDIKLEDLKNKSMFEATLYLKRNAINYEIEYEYSDTIKNGYVISQNPKKNETVSPNNSKVTLVISKGKEITVPDFKNKTLDDVIEWVVNNNLKISFNEIYHTTIKKGELIEINYKVNDKIDEGSRIIVTTSLGGLKLPNFNSPAEFKTWASENNVNYTEKYEFNDSVSKGKIVSLSIKSGTVIDVLKDNITITISYGSPVTVPNFVGKSKTAIQSQCNNIGLNCRFYYVGYNSASENTALNQNVPSGRKVVSGSYVNIGLSSGPAKTFYITIQSEWFSTNADATISTLKAKLSNDAPGVSFNFIKKSANSCVPGLIHPDSPIKGGAPVAVTQGNTYTIWIMSC